MRNVEDWKMQLFDEIRTIGNPRELEALWSGADRRNISSFEEEIAHVFDDYDIDGFLALSKSQSGLRADEFVALQEFRNEFSGFIEELKRTESLPMNYKRVLGDARWKRISALAEQFSALIDSHSATRDGGEEV